MKPLILFLIFSAVAVATTAQQADPLDAATLGLVQHAPRHRLNDSEARATFTADLTAAANEHEIDPYLLLTIAFYESSLSTLAIGGRGEIGLMQVHGDASRGCELVTQRGQLMCGASWLRKCFDACGTWPGAVTMYATGECKTKSTRVQGIVKFRINRWEALKNDQRNRL